MADNAVDVVKVSLDGRPPPPTLGEALVQVRVEESVLLPDTFELRFDDPHFELFDDAALTIGAAMEIALRSEGDLTVVTRGEITAITIEEGPGGRHQLVVTGLDSTHRLHRNPKSRSFVDVTDGDLVERIAREHGLDADIDTTSEVHPHVFQHGITDMALLRERATRIGYDLWISEDTLHFKSHPHADGTPPELTWGDNLLKMRVRFSSTDACDGITVRGWDPLGKRTVVGHAQQRDPGSDAPGVAEIAGETASAFGAIERTAGQFPVGSEREADSLAAALLLKASGGDVVLKGEAKGDPRIAAGAQIRLRGVGFRLAGSYRLTSVEHIYAPGSIYVTRFVSGGKEPAGLVDLLGRGNGLQSWGGLVVGTVTQLDDPERVGRVKVQYVDLDETESGWAQVVAPGAGATRGVQFLPEVGDTVVVGFEHGDTRRPLVLGGVWNRSDPPPAQQAVARGTVTQRTITTRTGHHLTFTEESEPAITLGLNGGDCRLHLEQDLTVLRTTGKLVIEGAEVEIRGTSKLALSAPTVGVDGSSSVTVTGGVIKLN